MKGIPAMTLWQMRKEYFRAPGTYEIEGPSGNIVSVTVDDQGLFEAGADQIEGIPVGVYAKLVRSKQPRNCK